LLSKSKPVEEKIGSWREERKDSERGRERRLNFSLIVLSFSSTSCPIPLLP